MRSSVSRLRDRPPLRLSTYKDSILRAKMEYVHRLLRWAVKWLAEVQDMDMDTAFDGLAHAKKVRRTANAVERTFEEAALAEMFHSGQSVHIGDGYTALLRTGRDRKGWKHDEVMEALIETSVERMQDRFPYVPEKTLRAIVTESMWQVHKTGRVDWRSTDLRAQGIDPDDYSTSTKEKPTIDLRGEASYASVRRRPRGVAEGD